MPDTIPESDGVLVQETGKGRFQLLVDAGGHRFFADEPKSAGGDDCGPNPYELLAAGLGACTTMTLRLYAERKGWPLSRVETRVVHRKGGLNTRDRFAREIALEGPLDDDQRRRLLEIADKCPVHLTLTQGSDVVTTLVNPSQIEDRDPLPDSHMRLMCEACRD